jgi:hypothetical protein
MVRPSLLVLLLAFAVPAGADGPTALSVPSVVDVFIGNPPVKPVGIPQQLAIQIGHAPQP